MRWSRASASRVDTVALRVQGVGVHRGERAMASETSSQLPQIIPYLYYEDAGPAVEFMSTAFGFEVEQAFRDPETSRVLHATVRTGTGVILNLSSRIALRSAGSN